jgi:VWFA-related protein
LKPALAVGLLACGALTASPSSEQVFRSGVQSVVVDVSVLRGRTPVTGLTAADFAIDDNGTPQVVASIDAAAIPLDVSLVVDATWQAQGLHGGYIGLAGTRALAQDAHKIAGLLAPDDRLAVLTYGAELVQTRAMSPVGASPSDIDVSNPTTFVPSNPVPIGQAVLTALSSPTPPERRHVVLVFSAARLLSEVPLHEVVVPAAARADALLYTVLHPPAYTVDTHEAIPYYPPDALVRDGLTRAAEATGGRAFITGNIVGAFRDILKEFRRSYVLRYSVQGVPVRGWHTISVTVPRCPACVVRARRGYMGG